ncbi:DUF4129 domain-containing protein [Carboxylicivirga marina]|uniref:DUF4129 domain-containing protein n=1 Tax=Carboxylicivirga marina TaxID=2800988 RepID=A0ABS1HID9_9BACT|nr:DUF4129 domain-containing protein [Carboxylicivirga marina]MBK3517431.1 DUF4129 domain-containing protein [Carboxylicivirga marina]
MKIIRLLSIVTILLLAFNVQADGAMLASDSIQAWDNSVVNYRCPSVDTVNYYRALPEYKYDLVKEPESILSKVLRWVSSFFTVSGEGITVLGWLLIIAAVLALLALIIKIAGIPIKGLFVFSKSTKVTQLNFGKSKANIEDQKLDNMLEVFINNQAYREATRIIFLQILRTLNRKGLIQWNAFKTDRDYFFELDDKSIKQEFLQIIRQYEYVWYGKFEISAADFEFLKANFAHFTNHLENRKAS